MRAPEKMFFAPMACFMILLLALFQTAGGELRAESGDSRSTVSLAAWGLDGLDDAELSEEEAAALPEWVSQPETQDGDTRLVVVSSSQWATVAEAEQEVREKARAHVRDDLRSRHSEGRQIDADLTTLPDETLAFRKGHVEEVVRQAGSAEFTVYRVHRQLELSPATREAAAAAWRDQEVQRRLWILGGLLGFATLTTAALSGYLRLDARTHGAYRLRLKLATMAAIVAAGAAVAMLVQAL